MELYTLDANFNKETPIDEYISNIWTERYTDSGDISLLVEATPANKTLLAAGTFIGSPDSDEVMLLETQDIKDGILKVSGFTLDQFLRYRYVIPSNDPTQQAIVFPAAAPGSIMSEIIQTYVQGISFGPSYMYSNSPLGVDGPRETLASLYLRSADSTPIPGSQSFSVARGTVLDAIKKLGTTHNVGWRLVPTSITPSSYLLAFDSYIGKDCTSGQTINALVRFSPNLESLSDVKELRSKVGYCTVAYAITPDFDPIVLPSGAAYTGKAYAYPAAEFEVDFLRRTMLVEITGVTIDSVNNSMATYQGTMDNHAKNALANNNFTKIVDGEVIPQNQYTFGVDYGLGDLIELESVDGTLQTARVTEYIRTQDANGKREYPTVSVI